MNSEYYLFVLFSLFDLYQQGSDMERESREKDRQQSPKLSYVRCKHCGKNIISTNYLIHEARCALMSSRVYRSEQEPKELEIKPEKRQIYQQKQQYPSVNPNYRKEEVRPKKPLRPESSRTLQQPKSEEEKIPCPFCGYMQTFSQLDTHPEICEHREQECIECHQSYPRSLMAEHRQVCTSHRRQPTVPRQNRPPQHYQYEEEEENYNPLGNFSSIFELFGRPRRQNRMPNRPPQQNTGFIVIQTTDSRGRTTRQVMPSGGLQQGFARGNGMSYSPFSNFFALLELMAARQGRVNQGLTKEQVKALKRVKFQGHQSASEKQKQLCTICYCEFEKDEKLIELRCKHRYHQQCITKWLQQTAKCPVCKAHQTDRPIFNEQDD